MGLLKQELIAITNQIKYRFVWRRQKPSINCINRKQQHIKTPKSVNYVKFQYWIWNIFIFLDFIFILRANFLGSMTTTKDDPKKKKQLSSNFSAKKILKSSMDCSCFTFWIYMWNFSMHKFNICSFGKWEKERESWKC